MLSSETYKPINLLNESKEDGEESNFSIGQRKFGSDRGFQDRSSKNHHSMEILHPNDKLPEYPFVTIVRPCSGLDFDLKSCLESSFLLHYPKTRFEIIMSVSSKTDESLQTLHDLVLRYPQINCKVIVGSSKYGPNPKIGNIVEALKFRSQYSRYIWVLDSNVSTKLEDLPEMVELFEKDRNIRLIHQLPLIGPKSRQAEYGHSKIPKIGGLLDGMYMNTMHTRMYMGINYLRVAPCIMGKSNLYRLEDIQEETNGLEFIEWAKFIGEDHMIGERLWNSGRGHYLHGFVVQKLSPSMNFAQYAERRMRWIIVRKYLTTTATIFEPFTESIFSALIGAISFSTLSLLPAKILFSTHVTLILVLDILVSIITGNVKITRIRDVCQWLFIWTLRETTALFIWALALAMTNVVNWRGKLFQVYPDMSIS